MIILDTNVVSEPMKPKPSPLVLSWLDNQISTMLYLTTTSLSELLSGVAMLPDGKRKQAAEHVLDHLLRTLFSDRILLFDKAAAGAYADIVSSAKRNGLAISMPDAQIAAIARCHGFCVATRDTSPFKVAEIDVIDPWQAKTLKKP